MRRDWESILVYLGIAIASLGLVVVCTADERRACEARDGVWLWRETACVKGPDE